MASGALLAAVIFIVQRPDISGFGWSPVLTGLLLLAVLAVPLYPGVFNRIGNRLAKRFQSMGVLGEARLSPFVLAQGMALTACGWLLLGISVWAMLQSVLPEPPALTLSNAMHIAATTALAYVAGFLALVVPSGVGVREYVLLNLLANEGAEPILALAVLLLRLVWTAAELLIAAVLWCMPARSSAAPLPLAEAPSIRYDGPRTTDHGSPT